MTIGIAFAAAGIILLAFWIYVERGHLLLPSTLSALKASGVRNVLNGRAVHGVFYGRWIPAYLRLMQWLMPRLGAGGKRWFGNTYHGKVLPHELARAIVTLDHDIPLTDLGERVVPYPVARSIVLTASPDIVVTECGCRATRAHSCTPSQVCMAVGKPFSEYILEHHPATSRRINREEALAILEDVHERGCVHHAYFKDTCLDAFYAICNCCTCCCTGFQAMRNGIPMIFSSGYVARVDESLCRGCGSAKDCCPFGAIRVTDGISRVDWEKCMGCGVCVDRCPNSARGLVLDGKKGDPLDVRALG